MDRKHYGRMHKLLYWVMNSNIYVSNVGNSQFLLLLTNKAIECIHIHLAVIVLTVSDIECIKPWGFVLF